MMYIIDFAIAHWSQIFVFALVIFVFAAFLSEKMSPDVIAMGSMVLVMIFPGVLTSDQRQEMLNVFGNPSPIIIACMFIMSAALENTGIIKALGNWFEKIAGKSEWRIFLTMFVLVACLSAVVNNTPIVVIFLPIVISIARKNNLKASKLLIPLSYAAIVGGTCTLVGTSTNLLASEVANNKIENFQTIGMFEITKLGLIYVFVTFVYMFFIGRKLLPGRITLASMFTTEEGKEYLSSAIITENSHLIGKKLSETELLKRANFRFVKLTRNGKTLGDINKDTVFMLGDELSFKTRVSDVMELAESKEFILKSHSELGLENLRTQSTILIETVIGQNSFVIGKTLDELAYLKDRGIFILAVHRNGRNIQQRFDKVPLIFGDTILVEGPVEEINKTFSGKEFLNLTQTKETPFRKHKAPFAIAAIIGFLLLGAFKVLPIVFLALAGAFFTIATKCIDSKEGYQAINWRLIFLIIGMLGLGKALALTGASDLIAGEVLHIFGSTHPLLCLAMIYLLTAILTEMISNQAVAVLITPLAIDVAIKLNVDPRAFIIAVMFGASASFATPIGYQTNTYIYGAGGYKFFDFTKVGLPLALILWLVAIFFIPIFWKLTPLAG